MKPNFPARAALLALGVAGLALIAGCHSPTSEETVDNSTVNTTVVTTINDAGMQNLAGPAPVPTNASAPPAASDRNADFTKDAQTQDDADATGMTSKLPQDNVAQPVKQ